MGKVVVAVLGVAAQAWWLGVTAGDVERKGWWSAWLALGMGLVASVSEKVSRLWIKGRR